MHQYKYCKLSSNILSYDFFIFYNQRINHRKTKWPIHRATWESTSKWQLRLHNKGNLLCRSVHSIHFLHTPVRTECNYRLPISLSLGSLFFHPVTAQMSVLCSLWTLTLHKINHALRLISRYILTSVALELGERLSDVQNIWCLTNTMNQLTK